MGPEEIQQILAVLAEKLGPMATKVWAIYLKQAYVEIAQNIGVGLLMAVLGYICWRFGLACRTKAEKALEKAQKVGDRYHTEPDLMMGYYFGLGITIACWLGTALILVTNLSQLLNPEYATIRLLLK